MVAIDKINKKVEYKRKVLMGRTYYESNLLQVFNVTYKFNIYTGMESYNLVLVQSEWVDFTTVASINIVSLGSFPNLQKAKVGVKTFLKGQVKHIREYIKD